MSSRNSTIDRTDLSRKTDNGVRAKDLLPLLRDRLVCLPGARDQRGGVILLFPCQSTTTVAASSSSSTPANAAPNHTPSHAPNATATASSTSSARHYTDLKNLVAYLLSLCSDDVHSYGITAIVDMRGGTTWHNVKPALKVLQENHAHNVHTAFIIKPDTFWEKQKTSLASSKYKFEITMISLEGLQRHLSADQLTVEHGGTLHYDHNQWMTLRIQFEALISSASEAWDHLTHLTQHLQSSELAPDTTSAKKAISDHLGPISNRIKDIGVENISKSIETLIKHLTPHGTNVDYRTMVKTITQTKSSLAVNHRDLLSLWSSRRHLLEKCFQLRVFQVEVNNLISIIGHKKDLFLVNYIEIGNCHAMSAELLMEHTQFAEECMLLQRQISDVIDSGQLIINQSDRSPSHAPSSAAATPNSTTSSSSSSSSQANFADSAVLEATRDLDARWRCLLAAIDDRSKVLRLAANLHRRSERYSADLPRWTEQCQRLRVPDQVVDLEQAIDNHQIMLRDITDSYSKLCLQGKDLLNILQTPISESDSLNSIMRSADYSKAAKHVLDVVHEIFAQHRGLEKIWLAGKVKLHQKLSLKLFQQDKKQVIHWLDTHGEVFLQKNNSIGRSLSRTKSLRRNQEHFEQVLQNTITNSNKLLSAAEALATSGECNADEIYEEARSLELRIIDFLRRVELRRSILELVDSFYMHSDELTSWFTELKAELLSSELTQDVTATRQLIAQFDAQKRATLDACANTIAEGHSILEHLEGAHATAAEEEDHNAGGGGATPAANASKASTNDHKHVQGVLRSLIDNRSQLDELWCTRRLKLDLCLQLRLFERDALNVSSRLDAMADCLKTYSVPEAHNIDESAVYCERTLAQQTDALERIQGDVLEMLNRGNTLSQVLDSSGLELMSDSRYSANSRISALIDLLRDRCSEVEKSADVSQRKLMQTVEIAQLQEEANQVCKWIYDGEQMLKSSLRSPADSRDAEEMKLDNEKFQQVLKFATHKLCKKAEEMKHSQKDQFDSRAINNVIDSPLRKWQNLMYHTQERSRMVHAAQNWFKTAEQVHTVLSSLEREYSREDDACHSDPSIICLTLASEKSNAMAHLISLHLEKKQAFLKACTLARRTSENYLKYMRRNYQLLNIPLSRTPEIDIKNELDSLLVHENNVLDLWTQRKLRLDHCFQYIPFEASSKQALQWIHEHGEVYLTTHNHVGKTKEETRQLLEEHKAFKLTSKETYQKVQLITEVGRGLLGKTALVGGDDTAEPHSHQHPQHPHHPHQHHYHAVHIENWCKDVTDRYKDFICRMNKYAELLETSLGLPSSQKSASDRLSDSKVQEKIDEVAREQKEDKRKSARRKQFIMSELLQTEKSYVDDLEICINCFHNSMQQDNNLPSALEDKIKIIFGNIVQIYEFHSKIFLHELMKCQAYPEDVGHRFVTWAEKFTLYVHYCKNKPDSNHCLVQYNGNYFEQLQSVNNLLSPLASYLIKPVQRITKYQLLLKDLHSCCDQGKVELNDGLEVMLGVPKRANDAMHLSMLTGFEQLPLAGELILQDNVMVWDTKNLIRKGRERQLFLFDRFLVFAKPAKDCNRVRYSFKECLGTGELGVTEHIEADACKFAVWLYRDSAPSTDNKIILKSNNLDTKQIWVRKLRERYIQERSIFFETSRPSTNPDDCDDSLSFDADEDDDNSSLGGATTSAPPSIVGGGANAALSAPPPSSPSFSTTSEPHQRFSRSCSTGTGPLATGGGPLGVSYGIMGAGGAGDRGSVISVASTNSNTSANSNKSNNIWVTTCDIIASHDGHLTLGKGQKVELIETSCKPSEDSANESAPPTEWCVVRPLGGDIEGEVQFAHIRHIADTGGSVGAGGADQSGAGAGAGAGTGRLPGQASPSCKRKSSFRKWLTNKSQHPRKAKTKSVSGDACQAAPAPCCQAPSTPPTPPACTSTVNTQQHHQRPLSQTSSSSKTCDSITEEKCDTLEEGLVEIPPPMEELQPNVQTTVGQQDSCHAVDNPTSNGKCLPNSATSNTTTNTTPANITGDINTASLEQLRIIVPGQITPNGDLTAEEEDCAKQDQNDCSDHAPYRHAPPPPATDGAALLTLAPPPDDAEDVLDPAITPDLAAEEISAEEIARRNKEINVEKRKYVLEELLSTELDYVRDLSQLIDGYMSMMKDENCEIQMPDNMTGKDKMVFGNIHQIRDWHRDMFSKELEKYVSDPDKIALLFLRSEKRLYMYVKYCENKPKSEYIVTEYFDYFEELRFKLGHKLQIPDLLIKPIQRIMKYQLLLRDIFKFTERAGEPVVNLRKAMDVMLVIPKAANDMMNVGRLQGFSGKITAQGKLLLQETISIMEVSSGNTSTDGKFRERRVFLFEQIVIISESEKRKNEHSNPSYIFKNSLKVNKMAIKDTYESDDLCFVLVDKMPGSDTQIIGKAASLEVKEKWVRTIKELLDMQGDFLRALQSPIAYQKELTKELLAPELIGKSSKTSKHGGKEGKSSSSNHKTKEPTTSARKLDKKNKDNSPKVKRTILGGFRATLRPKSKSHDSSVTATTGGNQQASSGNHGDANYKVSTAVLGAGGVASNGETGE